MQWVLHLAAPETVLLANIKHVFSLSIKDVLTLINDKYSDLSHAQKYFICILKSQKRMELPNTVTLFILRKFAGLI